MARAVLASRVRALRGGSHWRGVQVSAYSWGRGWGTGPVGAVGLGEAQSGCGRGPARKGQGGLPGLLGPTSPAASPLLPAPHSHISFLVGHAWPRIPQACPMVSQPHSLLGTLPALSFILPFQMLFLHLRDRAESWGSLMNTVLPYPASSHAHV